MIYFFSKRSCMSYFVITKQLKTSKINIIYINKKYLQFVSGNKIGTIKIKIFNRLSQIHAVEKRFL